MTMTIKHMFTLGFFLITSYALAGSVFPGDEGVTAGQLKSEPDVYFPQTSPVIDPSTNTIIPPQGPSNSQVPKQYAPQPTTAQ